MKRELNQTLELAGLTPNESAVYLASLALGESGMTDIAARAKLKRPTAYLAAATLQKRGLIGSFVQRSRTRYVASPPAVVESRLKDALEQFHRVIPQLSALEAQSGAPRISSYTGIDGYRVAMQIAIQEPGVILRHIGSLKALHSVVGEQYDIEQFVPERVARGIAIRCLYFQDEITERVRDLPHAKQLRDIRYLPPAFKHPTSKFITPGHVVLFSSTRELVTVIIESQALADSERRIFDLLWAVDM